MKLKDALFDLGRLRLLRELQARGTMTAVAKAFAYTPSAISQQLRLLEREVGVALLERIGRNVRLTDAGRALVAHTDAVFDQLELAQVALETASAGHLVNPKIAAFESAIVSGFVGRAIRNLHHDSSYDAISILDSPVEDALAALRIGDLDVVLANEYVKHPGENLIGIERDDLFWDPLCVVGPRNDPKFDSSGGRVHLRDLSNHEWAMGAEGTRFGRVAEDACRSIGGFIPRAVCRSRSIECLLALVVDLGLLALVPYLSLTGGQLDKYQIRRLHGAEVGRHVFLAYRRGSGVSQKTLIFRNAFRDAAMELSLLSER